MTTPAELPTAIAHRRMITYSLTRWDLVQNTMTIFLRNRILQLLAFAAVCFNAWQSLAPDWRARPASEIVVTCVVVVVEMAILLVLLPFILGVASSFLLKQRGLVGEHTLEITDQGLVERTEFNETLHRWPSVCRIFSLGGYLFIYVGDMSSHQVPKGRIPFQQLADFEAELRARAPHARSW